MSIPTTTRAFRRTQDGRSIELVTDPLPQTLSPTAVLIKLHAVSLNFRDVAILNDFYPVKSLTEGIPCSDAVATVIHTGSAVTDLAANDRVSVIFRQGTDENPSALGGDVDGLLSEYSIHDQNFLVKVPDYLSDEEASTIPCAGVTAWNALNMGKPGKTARDALMEGTGGVSLFAVLICLAAGIKAVITSSSDQKLSGIKDLAQDGEILGINYRTHEDWSQEVMRQTEGRGVDLIVNNVGSASLKQDFNVLRAWGTVSLVGFLGGWPKDYPDLFSLILSKVATVQAIGVGSKQDHQDLFNFLEKHQVSLLPLISKVFRFEDSREAFEYLYAGNHTGKVVIKL